MVEKGRPSAIRLLEEDSTAWSAARPPGRFLKEKLTLRSRGYAYHPRFLQYRFELSGALKQERYVTSSLAPGGDDGWGSNEGLEYQARLYLLPEHPYNLELFALRWEPMFKERSALEHDTVSESRGADVRYRKKPWFLHARYSDNSLESSTSSSDVDRLDADGEYFKLFPGSSQVSFRAAVAPTSITTPSDSASATSSCSPTSS
jgi:hypothetical protein